MKTLLLLLLLVVGFSNPTAAYERTITVKCSTRDAWTKALEKQYLEKVITVGSVNKNVLMEIYVSKKGAWSIMISNRAASACVVLMGDNFQNVKFDKK